MRFLVLKVARRFGYDIQRYGPHRDPIRRLTAAMTRHGISTILDIGANTGQFGHMIRLAGYNGRIISFEPLSAAHTTLTAAARNDRSWTVASRCAVGAKAGSTKINIAGNSKSSSLLPMTERHVAGDPASQYTGSEAVTVIAVDDYLKGSRDRSIALAAKIDTQGFEGEVLAGMQQTLSRFMVIHTEMSLAPVYQGGIDFDTLYRQLTDQGYRLSSMEPGFTDPKTYEVLQIDATFERRQ